MASVKPGYSTNNPTAQSAFGQAYYSNPLGYHTVAVASTGEGYMVYNNSGQEVFGPTSLDSIRNYLSQRKLTKLTDGF